MTDELANLSSERRSAEEQVERRSAAFKKNSTWLIWR